MIERILDETHANERLDRAVHRTLDSDGHALGRAAAKRLVEQGLVRVDGRTERRGSTRVRAGQRLVIDLDASGEQRRKHARSATIDLDDRAILARGDGWLVVDKPPGLPSHATRDPMRDHLEAAVTRWLAAPPRHDADLTPRVVHRLDRDTSGLVLVATTTDMRAWLGEAFARRDARKVYVAICHDRGLADAGRCDARLEPDRQGTVQAVRRGGRSARTWWRVLARQQGIAVVALRPDTGRKHQLRAHLAHLGAPIVHDPRYGGAPALGSGRCQLHAIHLGVPLPLPNTRIAVEAPWPGDFVVPRPAGFDPTDQRWSEHA